MLNMTGLAGEELALLLLNSSGEGIYGIDLEGNCTFANPACVQLLGFESDADLLGRNMHDLVHHTRPNGDPYPMVECQIYQAFRVGKGVNVDDEVMWRHDGSSFPAEYWSYPMVHEDELIGSVLTFVDITERKHAEEALRESEEQIRLLLDSTGEGIYGIDMDGNCTFANPACVRLLGFASDQDLLGRNMHDLVHHTRPDGSAYPMVECRIYQAFRKGEGVHADDEVMWRHDGTNFPAEYWSYPMERDGELVGSVLTFVDITQRRRAERRLRDSEQQVRLLLDSTGEGIYGVDTDGNCTFANPACVEILGFDSDSDLLGRNMHELVHHTRGNGQPYPMEECQIYKAFRRGEGVHVDDEVMWRRDGSSFPSEYWSFPMEQDGKAVGSVLTFMDITERKQMEVKLRIEHDRAERLLLNVLPAEIAKQLKERPGRTIAEEFDHVSVLFADLVGFTPLAARLGPEHAVELLNEIFSAFDRMADRHGVEKIKTLGDGYMAVAGAPVRMPDQDDSLSAAEMALEMRDWVADRSVREGWNLRIRIGINRGPAVGAIIGTTKFMYDMWGDTVNVAARMESHGEPGRIQVTESVWEQLKDDFALEPRGEIEVKGKGSVKTWWLESATE
jgi:PAS domain S-box-containing protein